LHRPGHIFPLRARDGGVLTRPGHTEAGVDLATLAGVQPAALLAEVVNDDGSMARLPDLERFAQEHGLLMTSIADLIAYRQEREKLVRRVSTARMPTAHGDFVAHVYESVVDGEQHTWCWCVARSTRPSPVLVRVHSECPDPATCSARGVVIVTSSSTRRWADRGRGAAAWWSTLEATRNGIGLAHKLSRRMRSRSRGWTRSRRTWRSGCGRHAQLRRGLRKIWRTPRGGRMRLMTNNRTSARMAREPPELVDGSRW
jgi:3,4-dihydroxy 2-butanone 4-phosphate synthase/GTP cyclohydrolase II